MATPSRRIRTLLADDEAASRLLLRLLLDSESDFEVIAEATTGTDAVARAAEHQPDLIVSDNQMPSLTGLEALPALRRAAPDAVLVIFSSDDDPVDARIATQRGAAAYLTKDTGVMSLLDRLRELVRASGAFHVEPG